MICLKHLLYITLFLLSFSAHATHIVGAELYYDYLGKSSDNKNIYQVTLKLYRDCTGSNNAELDENSAFTIKGGGKDFLVYGKLQSRKFIPQPITGSCSQVPHICVEEGIYTFTLELEPAEDGYYIIYQRCCRNNTVANLVQSGRQGTTCYIWIPGSESVPENSSPRFKNFPPMVLCNNVPLFFDHSAVDPDGDVLEYSLGTAYDGLSACCPVINTIPATDPFTCISPPAGCPDRAPYPPYTAVTYKNPYSATYPLPSDPVLNVDIKTGLLKGRPNLTGQYVICVVVKEYRNGVLLNTHYRDFQFNVVNCVIPVMANFADQTKKCVGNLITFTNQSVSTTGGEKYHWDFGVPGTNTDTSSLVHPSYHYPDTGTYEVTLIGTQGPLCSDTMKKKIYIHPPFSATFSVPPPQCLKDNSFSFKAVANNNKPASFNWLFPPGTSPQYSDLKDPGDVFFSSSGMHAIKLLSKQDICEDVYIDSIKLVAPPHVDCELELPSLCAPVSCHFVNKSIGEEPMSFLWRLSDGIMSQDKNISVTYTLPGIYSASLALIPQGVCKDTSYFFFQPFTIHSTPKGSFAVTPDSVTLLDPHVWIKSTQGIGLHHEYDFGDGFYKIGKDPFHSFGGVGTFVITEYLLSENGCRDTTHQKVYVEPDHRLWIPNAFTPDKNNLNDVFRPVLFGVTHYRFEIFDRWGHLIFSTEDPREGWKGDFKGRECPQDVYVWRLSYKDDVKSEFHKKEGHVTLLRSP